MKSDQISTAETENHASLQSKSGCDPKKQSTLHGGAMDEAEVVFRKFDKNGDGKISHSELNAILNALGTMPVSEEEVDRIMKEVDLDGDGFIDIKEFAAVYCPSSDGGGGSNSDERDLREAFDLYDIDKNGKITASELHKTLKRLGEKCTLKDCRRMISRVDVDGDGSVNFEEFKKMMGK